MKHRQYDGSASRRILRGMIVDQKVCSRISSQWTGNGLFSAEWANLVGNMVVSHFRKYGQPPNSQMVSIFEKWADTSVADDKTIELMERFLQSLSDEQGEVDSDVLLDNAKDHFGKVLIDRSIETAKALLEKGDVASAREGLLSTPKVNLGAGSYIEPASGIEIWMDAFSQDRERPLVRYRGALGKFIGDSFTRKTLYSFMAPDKIGKTTWMLDLAYRGLRNRRRVAFFDVGDSTENEILVRLGSRATGMPRYDSKLKIPFEWDKNGELQLKEVTLDALDPITSFQLFKKVTKSEDSFRLAHYPNSTVNVNDIDSILADWKREGWSPDLVFIDYADILAPPAGVRDKLDQIDETWKGLRRISQARDCCVITATQSDATAYKNDKSLLSKKNFSGRKTKLAHVNGMIGINVSHDEKSVGAARINWIVRRKGRYNERSYVKVAGSMDIACPVMISQR